MRILFTLAVILSFSSMAVAAEIDTITVGRCRIEVAIMKTPQEHASGLLGYTERTYPYEGMLFDMLDKRNKKTFHTVGMKMTIIIMGVTKLGDGSYKVIDGAYKAPPGRQSIPIDAPDVLEIPEGLYHLKFKHCLGAQGI